MHPQTRNRSTTSHQRNYGFDFMIVSITVRRYGQRFQRRRQFSAAFETRLSRVYGVSKWIVQYL